MTADNALLLHLGHTLHRRFQPFDRSFDYKLLMIEIDVDRLDEASKQCGLFSVGRFNLFSFRAEDHGSCGKTSLRAWADGQFETAGIDATDADIRLLTFPRHLFYKFAPISVWVARADGEAVGVIYEVRNTFGERHIYVAKLSGDKAEHSAPKQFHVSPFFGVTGDYRFRLSADGRLLDLTVTNVVNDKPTHMARLTTHAKTADNVSLLQAAILRPLSTFGVSFAIHWQALRLWLKGAKYHRKPSRDETKTTVATTDPKHRNNKAA